MSGLRNPAYRGFGYGALMACAPQGLKKNRKLCRYCEQPLKVFIEGFGDMSKRELIDCICEINKSAKPEFLATFPEDELKAYLEHLMELDLEELLVCA
jgi:hypothetical protein